MSIISGISKKYDGTAIDYVSIYNWEDGKCIAQVVPDATGAWEYEYFHFDDSTCGITYVADGCAPITHGAYLLSKRLMSDIVLQYSFDSTAVGGNESPRSLVGGASIDILDKKFGEGSLRIEATSQHLLTNQIPAIGTGDFCIEFFAKTRKKERLTFFDTRYAGNDNGMAPQSSNNSLFGFYSNGAWKIDPVVPINLNNWTHLAFTRDAGLLRMFVGGKLKASGQDNTNYNATRMMIGNNAKASDHCINGNIDNFLFTNNARYTKDFIPPHRAYF